MAGTRNKAAVIWPSQDKVVITDSEGSVIDSELEHMGDGEYRIKFSSSVIAKDIECTVKWHEEE